MTTAREYIQDMINEELSTLKSASESIAEISEVSSQIEKLLEPLEDFSPASSISYRRYSKRVVVSFWNAETVKEFEKLFEKYEEAGIIRTDEWKCETSGTSRVYKFEPPEPELGLEIQVSAKTCKLVKVGVKTVEQPIYEVQCEEEQETAPVEASS